MCEQIKPKCSFYNEETCSPKCKSDWEKCDICGKYLDWSIDNIEGDKPNCYEIHSSITSCDDSEFFEHKMYVCPECYKEKIKILRKK